MRRRASNCRGDAIGILRAVNCAAPRYLLPMIFRHIFIISCVLVCSLAAAERRVIALLDADASEGYALVLQKGIESRAAVQVDCHSVSGPLTAAISEALAEKPAALIFAFSAAEIPAEDTAIVEKLRKAETPIVMIGYAAGALPTTSLWTDLTGLSAEIRNWRLAGMVSTVHGLTPPLHDCDWLPQGKLAATVLLGTQAQVIQECDRVPVTWRDRGENYVFATVLGASEQQLLEPQALDVIAYGLLWTLDGLRTSGLPRPGFGGSGETQTLTVLRTMQPKKATAEVADSATGVTGTAPLPQGGAVLTAKFAALRGSQVRIELLSSLGNSHYACLAELQLYDESGAELSRENWSISASSEQAPAQPAKNLLDGDQTTSWHSRYINRKDAFPFVITIKLGAESSIAEIRCTLHARNAASGIATFRLSARAEDDTETGSISAELTPLEPAP